MYPATSSPTRSPASRHGGEVDVRGQVGQARPQERIGVRAMAVMPHEGARAALRVVVLALREAVIEHDHRAAFASGAAIDSTSASAAGFTSLV